MDNRPLIGRDRKLNTVSRYKRPRVLVIAEAANPEWASVPLIGWSLSQALSKIADVHLVTQVRNEAAIARAGLVPGVDFTAIDSEYVARPIFKLASKLSGGAGKGWTTLASFAALSYYAFEWEVWKRFRARLDAGEFDLVHRITPLSPTNHSLIAKPLARRGIPFIVGPLNGGVPWPKQFIERQHAEKEWMSYVRGAYRLLPGYRITHRYSSAVIAGSRHTFGELPRWAAGRRIYIPENGVDPARFNRPRERSAKLPLRAAFLGRLVPYKGVDMLLEAAAGFLRAGTLELDIIGDGPERASLEDLVRRLDLPRVTFHGWLPHIEVPEKLRQSDVLALPSIREFGGGVVIEAMALGLAPIVADYAGPGELVDASTGFKVPFTDRISLVEGLRGVLAKCIESPELVDRLGAAGRAKVLENLTWDAKARQISTIYEAVLDGANELPTSVYSA